MPDIRLIALDLDGTLLNSRKELPPANAAALKEAAARGITIVPTTGRFYRGMPEVIRNLPYVRYAIAVNGAQIYDVQEDVTIAKAELPNRQAVEIMEYLDTLPVIYDCFMDGWGWMTQAMQEKAWDFAPDGYYLDMLRNLRQGVPELKAFLRDRGHGVQKIQLFTRDMSLRQELLDHMQEKFPDTLVSSSVVNNVEINNIHANKGEALLVLAAHLGLARSQTMAFGDALNDLSMVRSAGIGVAMSNGHPDVRAAADYVTTSCDEDGVAAGIRRFCLSK